MKIKLASFNISGGFYSGNESSEYLDRRFAESIDSRLLNDIIENINNNDIDIICFQEIITTDRVKYIQNIIDKTNLKYSHTFQLSPCNLVKDTDCGLAILSRFPITTFENNIFSNPLLSKTTTSGNTYYTFDKGYLICDININGKILTLLNHHGFPYRRFNSTPEDNANVFEEFDMIIKNKKPNIIVGDFNAENFIQMMSYTLNNYKRTIDEITTTDGKCFDDILITKNIDYKKQIFKSFSDHFIVAITIEI